MPSKLQLTEGLVELIILAKEGLTVVERSDAFDEWVARLTEVSEGAISTQERRVINWLLEIVRKRDVVDFSDFDLTFFSLVSELFNIEQISDDTVENVFQLYRYRQAGEADLREWFNRHTNVVSVDGPSSPPRSTKPRYFRATLLLRYDDLKSGTWWSQVGASINRLLYDAINADEALSVRRCLVEELANFQDEDLEVLEWASEVVAHSSKVSVIKATREIALSTIINRTGATKEEANVIFSRFTQKAEE
jgi:hypothetical protein